MLRILALLLALTVGNTLSAQKQLVVLKGERTLLNLSPGDDFVFRQKGHKSIRRSFVNNLSDTAVVTHKDTIPLHTIDRIYFKRRTAYNVAGTFLTIAGAGYFLIDQFNNVVVNGNEFHVDERVGKTSAILVGVGLPMMLIRKKSERIHGRSRIRVVGPDSPFYKPELKRFI